MRVIAHGIDIVDVVRVEGMIQAHGDRFIERCFTEAEQRYAGSGKRRQAERFAVRFACKEAVMKALGTGWRSGISWRDIEVLRGPSGQPGIRLTGMCADVAAARDIRSWLVSLSHTDSTAIASVLALG